MNKSALGTADNSPTVSESPLQEKAEERAQSGRGPVGIHDRLKERAGFCVQEESHLFAIPRTAGRGLPWFIIILESL